MFTTVCKDFLLLTFFNVPLAYFKTFCGLLIFSDIVICLRLQSFNTREIGFLRIDKNPYFFAFFVLTDLYIFLHLFTFIFVKIFYLKVWFMW